LVLLLIGVVLLVFDRDECRATKQEIGAPLLYYYTGVGSIYQSYKRRY